MRESLTATWNLFFVPGYCVEVRALGCSGKNKAWAGFAGGVVSGYFDDADAFCEAVEALDKSKTAEGIYITLNPVNPELLARANNRLVGIKKGDPTTSDIDIAYRRWLLIDIDPTRPSGISSTDDEVLLVNEAAERIQADLGTKPVKALSGNGIHLLYRVDLPNDEATRKQVAAYLKSLSAEYGTDKLKIDTTVFNAVRMAKVYGTVVRKGDATATRKHRRSKLLHVPDELLPLSFPAASEPPVKQVRTYEATSLEKVESALRVLPAHFGPNSYDRWVNVLMAVHAELGEAGIDLCERYIPGSPGEIAAKFGSFHRNGTTIGTLFAIAKEYGWSITPDSDEYDGFGPSVEFDLEETAEEVAALAEASIKNLRGLFYANERKSDDKRLRPEAIITGWIRAWGADLYRFSSEQLEPIRAALLEVGQTLEWIEAEFAKLIKNAFKRTLPLSRQIEMDLQEWEYDFWLNDMDDTLWNGDRMFDDPARAILKTKARDNGYGGKGNPKTLDGLEDACIAFASRNRKHPVREWLNALAWDGEDHIAALSTFFHGKTDDEQIIYSDGTTRSLFHAFFRRWLIGSVARQMGDPNAVRSNFVLVLAMKQDSGKSHFANWICPMAEHYYVEKHVTPDNRDCNLLRTKIFVWEIMELGATTRRADVEALKGFITSTRATERKAYGHFDTVKPAIASYIGTVNSDGSGFLSDTTGNRRFAVVDVAYIDWNYSTAINPDQVWAQAVALWNEDKLGYRMNAEESIAQKVSAAEHMEYDLMADMINRVYEVNPEKLDWRVSSSEILGELRAYGGLSHGNDRAQGKDLAKSLKNQWEIVGKRSHGSTFYAGLQRRETTLSGQALVDAMESVPAPDAATLLGL